MYSFTRSLMGRKLARMLIQVSVVVSTTSTRLMPSMPTVYSMPKAGIQGTFSTKVKPDAGGGGVEGGQQRQREREGEQRDDRAPRRG